MRRKRQPSLKRRLIVQPLVFHLAALLISFAVLLALLLRIDSGGRFAEETVASTVVNAIVRRDDGRMALRMTKEIRELRSESPDLWFVVRDERGATASFGQVPIAYRSMVTGLKDISHADLRDRSPPYRLAAVIRRERGPAGAFTILAHGKLTALTFIVLVASNVLVIPVFLLIALETMIVTPWIVRRALVGVSRIAGEAERIDIDQRGIRLSENKLPMEIEPLVRAVNDALSRLDEGYERQRRFIASAAHELRTPIAILRVKLDAANSETARYLTGDVARLANLTEQLLDLQRLDNDVPSEPIDLAILARGVAADLAPLLIASDKMVEVEVEHSSTITGNSGAIERVVTNLVQNAVEHGGNRVTIRVIENGFEVEDDGPGIPVGERERVFEPFHRLRPRQTGAGLGLNLVQQIVERHHGRVTILEAVGGGAVVRVSFTPAIATDG